MKVLWTAYITCFCSAGEQPYMWQDYAEGGTGCALVFNYEDLLKGSQGGKRYAFFRVRYDQEMQIGQIEHTVDHAIHFERELEISGREHRDRYWKDVAFALMTCAVRFKDPMWRHEEEVRLWVAGGPDVTPFEVAGKPRVSIAIETSSLKRVIRGPAAGDNLSTDKIKELLSRHDFGVVPVVEAAG